MCFFSDYVDTLRKLLFTLPKSELNKTRARYTVRAPEPLNRQFPGRVSKEEAVRGYEARKQMKKTVLFPSGQFSLIFMFYITSPNSLSLVVYLTGNFTSGHCIKHINLAYTTLVNSVLHKLWFTDQM